MKATQVGLASKKLRRTMRTFFALNIIHNQFFATNWKVQPRDSRASSQNVCDEQFHGNCGTGAASNESQKEKTGSRPVRNDAVQLIMAPSETE